MQFSKFMPLVCAFSLCAGFVAIRAEDTPSQAAARAALEAKMRELDAQQGTQSPAAQSSSMTSATQASPAMPMDNEAQAKAMAALNAKMAELDKEQPIVIDSAQTAAPMEPRHVKKNYPGKSLGLPPIAPPPAPVSLDKQAQLQALLSRYMADQISPDEYQRQRAAILGN